MSIIVGANATEQIIVQYVAKETWRIAPSLFGGERKLASTLHCIVESR
jgi:hypothetical protein